jgi:hypothetical protein
LRLAAERVYLRRLPRALLERLAFTIMLEASSKLSGRAKVRPVLMAIRRQTSS